MSLLIFPPVSEAQLRSIATIRGFLVDWDCRWKIIQQALDDRTRQERGEEELTTDRVVIPRTRYGTIDTYLSNCGGWQGYNDIDLIYDEDMYETMVEDGVDETMARHVAHLFIRESLSICLLYTSPSPRDS